MARRKWIPFLGATVVALTLAAIVTVAEWGNTAALALAAVVGSAIVSASIPYAFGVRDRQLALSRNGRNGQLAALNGTMSEVRFTQDLLAVAGQHTRASSGDVDLTVETSAR